MAKRTLVNAATGEADTPLHIAAQAGYEEVGDFRFLIDSDKCPKCIL